MPKPNQRPYYVLFVREAGQWSYEFGDYDRRCVVSEADDWRDHYNDDNSPRRKKDTLILELKSADQWRIDAVYEALNALAASDPMGQAIGISILTFKLGG
jgi:hypothetical protein